MKKGLIAAVLIALAFGAGVATFIVKHNLQPAAPAAVSSGTETSAQLAGGTPEPAPAPAEAPKAETPAPAAAMTPIPPQTEEKKAEAAPTPAPEAAATAASGVEIDIAAATAERTMGSDSAPVTVIEYAALTCPHCARFATTVLPEVKAKLIDPGKVKLVFRDFPFDQHAMNAAKLARCAPPAKYFDLVEVIFKNQSMWTTSADPEKGLMQLGSLAGMGEEYMKNCMGNVELENSILRGYSEAQSKFDVRSTPTFVFNYGAEILRGEQTYEQFEAVVNRLSAGK
jgi:protein-disulfide isomerase